MTWDFNDPPATPGSRQPGVKGGQRGPSPKGEGTHSVTPAIDPRQMTPGQRTARLAEIEAELPEWERAETIARSDEKALRDLISDVTAEMRSLTSTAHGIVWPRRYDDAPPEWSYAGIRQIQPYIARIDELRRSVAAESIGAREARERAEDAARIVAALKSQRQSIVKEAYRDR